MNRKLLVKIICTIFMCIIIKSSFGQAFLNNPSFEDEPADATIPEDWSVCNSRSTPDILPGYWGVDLEAKDGETYIGLISREDNTTEHIMQRLRPYLNHKGCYNMTIGLAHSEIYAGYNSPIKLNIWLGDRKCKRKQLIFESPLIQSTQWKNYYIQISPEQKSKFIYIEAISPDKSTPKKGNILIDHLRIQHCIRA